MTRPQVERGDRDGGCRCRRFVLDLFEITEDDDGEVHGWYGPKCPHHPQVETDAA